MKKISEFEINKKLILFENPDFKLKNIFYGIFWF